MARRAGYFPVRRETLGRTADSTTLTAATANASANTKGTYATIGTTTFEYSGFTLLCKPGTNPTARFRFDIALNTGGSDVIIVEDFFVDGQSGQAFNIWFPIAVPSGAAIKARCQATTGSSTMNFATLGEMVGPNGYRSYSRCISCTDFTNSDATNGNTLNGTTQTAWAVVEASTTARIAALYVSPSNRADATRTSVLVTFDVGWGAGGSERILLSLHAANQGATNWEALSLHVAGTPFWCDLPAATALSVRSVASAACTDTFGVCLNGLVP